jgi:hypothetical protein
MARGLVLVYFSQLGGRLCTHQKVVLEADAKAIAKFTGYDFGGNYGEASVRSGPVFFVPDDTLLLDEAVSLGICSPDHLYGGVVPHPFVKTKAITHGLVGPAAARPQGWSSAFTKRVREIVLPGYTVFSAREARTAAKRMFGRGPIRVKKPLGASGKGQTLVSNGKELEALLEKFDADEMTTYGLVLEENLQQVRTVSVGRVTIGTFEISYHGTQRRTKDNEGRPVYGGSDLVCVRGGWETLAALPVATELRAAIAAARLYDEAMVEYAGFVASRRNYDVVQGIDIDGQQRSGVLESSWRIGGASSAELVAMAALAADPSLPVIRASHVEEFGKHCRAPTDAILHFQGEDPDLGHLLRYTVIKLEGAGTRQ